MPIAKPDYQLAFDLDLPEMEEGAVSMEEARLRSETALKAFELRGGKRELPAWYDEYATLRSGGWPWRVAAYIAWASSPKVDRVPKTQDELAREHLGLTSDRAFTTWRKRNPTIDEMVTMLQAAPLWEHRADSFKQLIDGMKKSGLDYKFFHHLKLYFEMTGDYIPMSKLAAFLKRSTSGGLEAMSDEELEMLARAVRNDVGIAANAGGEEETE